MSGWPIVTLAEVAKIERHGIHASAIPNRIIYVGLENIDSGGRLFNYGPVVPGELASSKFAFTDRHVLYGKLRPYLAKIARPTFDGICSTDILPILPGANLDRDYLAYFLRQPKMVELANSRASGANLPRISPRILTEFMIPLPPLEEQQRIVEVLDRAEAVQAKRQEALTRLDELICSLFLDMFGDPVVNPHHFPVVLLGSIGSVDRGISKHRPRNAPELLGGPYPLIQTGEVANCDGYVRTFSSTYSEAGLRQSKLWPAGTLCITIAANIAKAGILTFEACFPDSVVGFTAEDPATVEFVRVWLSFVQRTLEERASEFAQKNINLVTLRNLTIPVPPIDLQRQFARRVEAVERVKAAQREHLAGLDELFASLQDRAFGGTL